MAEHTYHIPTSPETTRFDHGDELHFHAGNENLIDLETVRARRAAEQQNNLIERELTQYEQLRARGEELAAARKERLAA